MAKALTNSAKGGSGRVKWRKLEENSSEQELSQTISRKNMIGHPKDYAVERSK